MNQVKGELRDGYWAETDEASITWCGTYVDGKRTGLWTAEKPTGETKTMHYVAGQVQGHVYHFRANGSLEWDLEYLDGQIHGRARFYALDGTRLATYLYIHEKMHGTEEYQIHPETPPRAVTFLPKF